MKQFSQCMNCNNIFFYWNKPLCGDCATREIEMKIKVRSILEKNPTSTLDDLILNTGIKKEKLIDFIYRKEILLPDNSPITYSCYYCDATIKEGKLCKRCSNKLLSELKK